MRPEYWVLGTGSSKLRVFKASKLQRSTFASFMAIIASIGTVNVLISPTKIASSFIYL